MKAAGGCSWMSHVGDSDGEGADFAYSAGAAPYGWSFPELVRLLSPIEQTLVVICKGGRCEGDARTVGEVITLAAGRVC